MSSRHLAIINNIQDRRHGRVKKKEEHEYNIWYDMVVYNKHNETTPQFKMHGCKRKRKTKKPISVPPKEGYH